MRAVITGGFGFVGASLTKTLVEAGHDVLVIDNGAVGSSANLAPEIAAAANLATLDILDFEGVKRALAQHQAEAVFHLAANHFIPECNRNPAGTIRVNVEGTQRLLDAIKATPSISRLVFTSTAAVYAPDVAAHNETTSLVQPDDIYGKSKLWGETLVHAFNDATKIDVGIARLFNVFGPGETNPHFIPSMIRQAQDNAHLLVGNIDSRRDYVFVEDVVSALVALESKVGELHNFTCNVGTGTSTSGHGVIAAIAEALSIDVIVENDPSRMRPSDRPNLLADNRRAREVLGWTPQYDLVAGLRRALEVPLAPSYSANAEAA